MNFLQCPVSCFRQQKVGEYDHDKIRAKPNVSILGVPIQSSRIYEEGGSKGTEPGEEEVKSGSDAENVSTLLVVGIFSADQPCVGSWKNNQYLYVQSTF